jgi:hypothetical protein
MRSNPSFTRRDHVLWITLALAGSAALAVPCTAGAAVFTSTGAEQIYSVSPRQMLVHVVAVGGEGGTGNGSQLGGKGGVASADLPVTPGSTLYIEVGGNGATVDTGGFNGGGVGATGGGGGGGASDVRTAPAAAAGSLSSRVLIAGGGGGGGIFGGDGGDGGASLVWDGAYLAAGDPGTTSGTSTATPGGGGSASGGTGGAACNTGAGAEPGIAGSLGAGGAGGLADAGGGGGGYYGGGGGGGETSTCAQTGGGGGSSFGPAGTLYAVDATGVPSITITAAAEQLSAASLNYGSQPQTTVSGPQTVTITNSGDAPLTLSGWSFAGADPADFSVGSSTCSRALAPSASCQLSVRFVPEASGGRSAILQIGSDQVTPASVSVSGTGGSLPAGPQGPAGRTGKIELVTCKTVTVTKHHHKAKRRHCTVRFVSRPVKFRTEATG